MNSADFVKLWKLEHDELLRAFLDPGGDRSAVAQRIAALGLNPEQLSQLRQLFEVALTDVFYTLLLGLDGAGSIGGVQRRYQMIDEDGNSVAADGDIKAEAYIQFHEEPDEVT